MKTWPFVNALALLRQRRRLVAAACFDDRHSAVKGCFERFLQLWQALSVYLVLQKCIACEGDRLSLFTVCGRAECTVATAVSMTHGSWSMMVISVTRHQYYKITSSSGFTDTSYPQGVDHFGGAVAESIAPSTCTSQSRSLYKRCSEALSMPQPDSEAVGKVTPILHSQGVQNQILQSCRSVHH